MIQTIILIILKTNTSILGDLYSLLNNSKYHYLFLLEKEKICLDVRVLNNLETKKEYLLFYLHGT